MTEDHYLKRELYELVRTDPTIFEFLQEGSLDGIWYWDVENPDHEWMSPRFWHVLGQDPAEKEQLAREWHDLIHPGDLATAIHNFEAHCADPDHPYDQVVRYRHSDGSTVWVRCRGLAVRDETGRPLRMLGCHTNVTELKEAELRLEAATAELSRLNEQLEHDVEIRTGALAAAEEKYRQIFENAPDGIFQSTAVGRVTAANPAMAELLGYASAEQLVGSLSDAGLEPHFPSGEWEELLRRACAEDSVRGFHAPLTRTDGAVIWISANIRAARDESGNVQYFDGTLEDITERKALFANLTWHASALERSNRDLTDFAYVASHDLKSPLRDIQNLATWIAEDAGGSLPPDSRRHLDRLRGRVSRLEGLLDGLLSYSRVGRILDDPEEFDAIAMITEVSELVGTPDDRFELVLPAGPAVSLKTPKPPLELVLRNLIDNAFKHHDKECGKVEITLIDAGAFVEFSVRDDGPGIAPQDHDRVFRMFQTLKPRDEVEGSGMGLALAKKLVETHGGSIGVESGNGRGATIHFTWPKSWEPTLEPPRF